MLTHAFSCLQGPITRSRGWWHPESHRMENPNENESPTEVPFRSELVERIRREIAAGTYETPHKWEIALERLLDHLEG